MGGTGKIVEKIDKNQIAEVTLTRQVIRQYLSKMRKENVNEIILEIRLPRPMIPKALQ